ncbi:hypothetical protein BD414DRAFT_425438, partial [Trametes punicea]
ALLMYEYIITFNKEVSVIWGRKKTSAIVLFLVIRYSALLVIVVAESISYSYTPLPDHQSHRTDDILRLRCSMYAKVQAALQVAQYLPWAAFSGLRALALSGMNWTYALIVFVLACGPFAVNMVRAVPPRHGEDF